MRIALPVVGLTITAVLWTLVESTTSSAMVRCGVLWTVFGAAWAGIAMITRFAPASPATGWLERHLPAAPVRFSASRRVFAVALGAIFLVAFWSWGSQVRGLVGERGLFPVSEQLAALDPEQPWWRTPTFCWLASGDASLLVQCWLGAALSLVMALGFCPGACALLCWALYLSLMSVGETFANFQWDALLLEGSLLAALWLPWRARPDWGCETAAQRVGRWLLWWLFFRLMIESGVVKLTWSDDAWLDYSALDFHFESQPLPLWTSWYAHHAPRWLLRTCCWVMYFIEIATPVLLFAPSRMRSLRHAAVIAQVLLQAAILATGNYTYFNWLTIALCLPFLDDSAPFLRRLQKPPPASPKAHRWSLVPAGVLALASGIYGFEGFAGAFGGLRAQESEMQSLRDEYRRTGKIPAPPWHQGLRSFNGYGLFRTMTRTRPEIILEGSADGISWREYGFPYKAGDVHERPALVAPHQPRLDWQMWFAALSPAHHGRLLERLIQRVLEGEPAVLALLEKNPFPDGPPRFARLSFHEYRFTRPEDRTAAWWKRELRGSTQAISLESLRRPGSAP
ncbi:MAG: lipase maturation factor family protein [Chthoniobacteraceae bacterium]